MDGPYLRPQPRWYLWHLEHIGIVDRSGPAPAASLWGDAERETPVPVAIIDTGLDPGHPNLIGAIEGPQVDYGPRVAGLVYTPRFPRLDALRAAIGAVPADRLVGFVQDATEEAEGLHRQYGASDTGIDTDTADLQDALAQHVEAGDEESAAEAAAHDALRLLDAAAERIVALARPIEAPAGYGAFLSSLKGRLSGAAKQHADAILGAFPAPELSTDPLPDPSTYFGVHGTSTAGLVGGRPGPAGQSGPAEAIRYFGVNPFCRIISLATPISHEIRPVINALVYAYFSGAEVIFMPRGVSDPEIRARHLNCSPYRTRIDGETERLEAEDGSLIWEPVAEDQAVLSRLEKDKVVLDALLRMISEERVLILAAGNDGFRAEFAYPASIAEDADKLIVVGARNERGVVSTYSNGRAAAPKPFYMLSDDAALLDRATRAIDRGGGDLDLTVHPSAAEHDYSPWGILSLDVRGSYGRAGDDEDEPDDHSGTDLADLYTIFGGTSAASAMMAGLVSLLMQAGRIPKAATSRDELRSAIASCYGGA